MKELALIAALLLAASPAAAQVATSGVQQPLGKGGQTNTSSLPNTGVICEEEMTATFCNVTTSPNSGGYGAIGGGAASSSGTGSAGSTTTSIPSCAALGPANELCN
jgi:opacity protein-like surface antigen